MALDEPKEATKNTTEKQASGSDDGTPEKEPELFTGEQLEEAKQLERIKAGRENKTLEAREKAASAVLSKAEKLMVDMKADADKKAEQKYQDDLVKAGDDTSARSRVELSKELRIVRAELGDTKTKLGERDEELTDARKDAAVSTKERNAREIASRYEVKPETLLLTDGTVESMEALAKQITGKEIKTLKADSPKTTTGGSKLTAKQVKDMSPAERASRAKDIADMPLGIANY